MTVAKNLAVRAIEPSTRFPRSRATPQRMPANLRNQRRSTVKRLEIGKVGAGFENWEIFPPLPPFFPSLPVLEMAN